MNCEPDIQEASSRPFCCIPRGAAREVWIYLLCQIANAGLAPVVTTIVIADGAGGFCSLGVDSGGNVYAQSAAGPDTGPFVLQDSLSQFWQLVVDPGCNRGTTSVAGPATSVPVLTDELGFHWELVVDNTGNLGANSIP